MPAFNGESGRTGFFTSQAMRDLGACLVAFPASRELEGTRIPISEDKKTCLL